MRRVVFACVVALLTFSTSGISALTVAEPCTAYEQPGREDRSCPPSCVTCGCCAQAAEPVVVVAPHSPQDRIVHGIPFSRRVPQTRAREVLHVPKSILA
jgi:hypothetical protein